MAVSTEVRTPEQVRVIDEMAKLQYQAKGIIQLIEVAGNSDGLSKETVPGACWALRDIIDRMSDLLGGVQS